MKAAVLHEYDEKLSNPQFVCFEEILNPKIQKARMSSFASVARESAGQTSMWLKAWRSRVHIC